VRLLVPSAAPLLRLLPALGVCCVLTLGCAGSDAPVGSASAPTVGTGEQDLAGGTCNVVTQSATGLTQNHLSACSPIDYPENPPIGGDHYSVWAAFQTFSFVVPRGFWVHDLEHGAIVFTYNCPDGCADEVAQVQALIDALPVDPLCDGMGVARRVVLTPDPLLDVRWGVSAWGHTLRADCVDGERFTQFYLNHFGLGPEVLCAPGSDFLGVAPCQ
jgi:hypothetical protein